MKNKVHMCKTESLCCEHNIINQLYFNLKKKIYGLILKKILYLWKSDWNAAFVKKKDICQGSNDTVIKLVLVTKLSF